MDEVSDTPSIVERFRLTGPITYTGQAVVQTDISNLKAALSGLSVADAFITSVTPNFRKGDRDVEQYYATPSAYLYAFADAMHDEYKAIADAGFILQLDRASTQRGWRRRVDGPGCRDCESRPAGHTRRPGPLSPLLG